MSFRHMLLFAAALAAAPSPAQETVIHSRIDSLTARVSSERLQNDIAALAGFYNRNTFSDTLSNTRGIGAARRWIHREFSRIAESAVSEMNVYYDWFDISVPGPYQQAAGSEVIRAANVVAVLPGTRSDRTLIINGHYDSRNESGGDITGFAPGANDDGSGVAALLELARILSREKLPNTVVLAAVTGEEQGLFGSTHMAADAVKNGVPVEGVIANDMIGSTDGGGGASDNTVLRCFSPDPAESLSRNFALYLNDIVTRYYPPLRLRMIFRLDRFGRGGDHSPFIKQGFAGVRFTEPWENYEIQHSALDVPSAMDFDYFTKTTALNAAAVWYWAMSPPPPLITGISRTPDYKTVITFTRGGSGGPPEAYIIRMRETDQLYWQESRHVGLPEEKEHRIRGTVYQVTLENRDQDYYIFGAAAVNSEGFESITATYDRDQLRKKAGR